MLKYPIQKATTTRTETSPDGVTTIQHITIEPTRWASRDISVTAKMGVELLAAAW